jgi:hypothetical protein
VAPGSVWAPFRHRSFSAMWSAQFVSNIGSWMQTVAAQWLMLTLTSSATYIALVQTAASLPADLRGGLGTGPHLADVAGSSARARPSGRAPPGNITG